ncbi:uncharacterized protein LOC111673176 [Seriola lalandi dorsalis]|uniref:uncharacterized protein LOC111673176 n=1 Tax=Seriola lalandi dorsalis TaxID=1841481 RepID=UPI000C6FAA59|nr:uncharacterized protein LOC111673176 [Seriola lalandi dorsalis]
MKEMLLQLLSFCFCGTFALNVTVYQAEEGRNITVSWDIQTKTDMSLSFLDCVLKSHVTKMLFSMHNGLETQDFQDEQFAGRVQFDKNAPNEGYVRLRLFRVRTDDSGNYYCKLGTLGISTILATTFTLNVTATKSVLPTQESTNPQRGTLYVWIIVGVAAAAVTAAGGAAVIYKRCRGTTQHINVMYKHCRGNTQGGGSGPINSRPANNDNESGIILLPFNNQSDTESINNQSDTASGLSLCSTSG